KACPSIARSKVLRPMRHGIVPDLFPVLVENQLAVGCGGEPGPLRELTLELAGAPTRIAERHQHLLRSMLARDVAQYLAARGHGDASVDLDRLRPVIIRAVDHKADLGLDRTAGENAQATG